MQFSGFRSVIGTMWAIGDTVAPKIAERFYRTLLEERAAGEEMNTAYALHVAVEETREEIGEKDFASWVPFVHYGV